MPVVPTRLQETTNQTIPVPCDALNANTFPWGTANDHKRLRRCQQLLGLKTPGDFLGGNRKLKFGYRASAA